MGNDIIEDDMERRFESVMSLEIEEKMKQLFHSDKSTIKWPRISQVPQRLRGTKDFEKHFEPTEISIGPYHHHKPELKPAEKLKLQMTKCFVVNSGHNIQALYDKIMTYIPELREWYSEEATEKYSNEDLAWMMLVDGCFLLGYMYYYSPTGTEWKDIQNADDLLHVQDLFLLENQIPFQVLELLVENSRMEDKMMVMIEMFIRLMTGQPPLKSRLARNQRPSHLLDLLRRILLGEHRYCIASGRRRTVVEWKSFRNVNELKAAGIRFKPNESGSLRDVSFKSSSLLYGVVRLPKIILDESTKSRLLNLIAYEMSSNPAVPLEVTSYVYFLSSLIFYPEDVKELRRQGVLLNYLGSDEEVVALFHEMNTEFVHKLDAYEIIKRGIQRHCDSLLITLMTQWNIAGFVGIVSVLAVSVLSLLFTGLQTYFTIFPRR